VGPKRELSLGGPAIVVAAESVQAGGPGSNRNPLPAGQRAYYNDRLFPENLIRDFSMHVRYGDILVPLRIEIAAIRQLFLQLSNK
jgi:hypothetical protein